MRGAVQLAPTTGVRDSEVADRVTFFM
jgi:hypothetical protein